MSDESPEALIQRLEQDAIEQKAPLALFFIQHAGPLLMEAAAEGRAQAGKPVTLPSPFAYGMY